MSVLGGVPNVMGLAWAIPIIRVVVCLGIEEVKSV